jgi:hypothetical protein
VNAYVRGRVVQVMPEEGAVIETEGAFLQGIFGVGGERQGILRMAVQAPDEVLTEAHLTDDMAGTIVVGGAGIEAGALRKAARLGIVGLVAGGIRDTDLVEFLGYDIGVAITGQEDIPLSIIVTEGFGVMRMAQRTFNLLRRLDGQLASINGATQIRAGVIRPEIVVPLEHGDHPPEAMPTAESQQLDLGVPIRIIREPYFGRLGRVRALPPELVEIESGARVRVLEAELDDGTVVVVPRANVEIIAEG